MEDIEEVEVWKDLPEFEGYYQISSFGRGKSLERKVVKWDGFRTVKERILKPTDRGREYLCFNLAKLGISKRYDIHVLVCIAFHGFIPCGHDLVPNHKDENKQNNYASNFEIVSSRKNISEAFMNKKTSSIYTGVTWVSKSSKWVSCITVGCTPYHLGYYKDEIEASEIYKLALNKIEDLTFEEWYLNLKINQNKTSEFKGVSWCSNVGKWRAQKCFKGVKYNLGLFVNEIDAANEYKNWKV